MSKQQSKASYYAYQDQEEVTLHAVGVDPTSGYKYFFEKSNVKIFPPEYGFFVEPPTGMVLQVFTPFHETIRFKTQDVVKELKIHDINGENIVKVSSKSINEPIAVYTQNTTTPIAASLAANYLTTTCRKTVAGRHGSIPEFKTEWDGIIPYFYCRTSSIVIYAELCGPDDLLTSAWNDITQCAVSAGVAAGLAAIVASPAAASPTFVLAFKTCLASKIQDQVNTISASLSVTQEANGDWRRC